MYMRILFSLFWVLIMSISDTYKFGDLLGKGGFGAVYNGLRKEENKVGNTNSMYVSNQSLQIFR